MFSSCFHPFAVLTAEALHIDIDQNYCKYAKWQRDPKKNKTKLQGEKRHTVIGVQLTINIASEKKNIYIYSKCTVYIYIKQAMHTNLCRNILTPEEYHNGQHGKKGFRPSTRNKPIAIQCLIFC